MGFLRVRAARGPLHEFDVSEEAYAADPDVYELLDPEPVAVSRPAFYVSAASVVVKKGKQHGS